MRINEWNQNANAVDAKGMGNAQGKVNAQGKINAKKLDDIFAGSCKVRQAEDSFRSSLQKSMVQEEAMKAYRAKTEKAGQLNGKTVSQMEREIGKSKAESINIRVERSGDIGEAKEVPVRQIPYSECDMVEINVLEGYVLKAKREGMSKGEEQDSRVYVEKKSDDGEVKAYLFHALYARKDGGDEMERIAYAVMERMEKA